METIFCQTYTYFAAKLIILVIFFKNKRVNKKNYYKNEAYNLIDIYTSLIHFNNFTDRDHLHTYYFSMNLERLLCGKKENECDEQTRCVNFIMF
jgi:hypothetical protein